MRNQLSWRGSRCGWVTKKGKAMACYHPLVRYEYYEKYKCQDGHMAYKARVIKPDSGEEYEDLEEQVRSGRIRQRQIIPCGKCIGCRLEYSREWATKGCYEAELHKDNWFLTLTYDNEHLPEADTFINPETGEEGEKNPCGTLVPEHMTLFLKRLRTFYKRKYNHKGIRYMGCGEYGDQGKRPHLHIILYNCPITPDKMKFHEYNGNHEALWRCTEIEEIWGKGMVVAAEVNWSTCAYVARYVTKKVGLPTEKAYYKSLGIAPEFFRMSRKPGIGREYYEQHKDEIYKKDEVIIKKYGGGTMKLRPPKYYDKLYDITNHEEMEKIKEDRKKQQKRITNLKYSQTTKYKKEQLLAEEETKQTQNKTLIRNKL